ncbi:MAG: hypothetical protein IJI73_09450 [Kiritimatiellae bacterium]|nr:hypothetical protein [Kiritimatiellia bacterium]
MTVRRAVVYAVLLAAAVSLWLFTHSERAQIKRVFADVERLAAKEQGEPVMECAGKAQALARHFKDGCVIIDLRHGLKTSYLHDDIAGGLLAFRSAASRVVVEFQALDISVDGSEASVEGLIDYSGTEATWPRYEPKAEKFIAHLEKTDGQWFFSRIKVP